MGLQEATCGGSAHREALAAVLLTELEMSLLLQAFKQVWQKRDQALGTQPIERVPGQYQRLLDLRPIPAAQVDASSGGESKVEMA